MTDVFSEERRSYVMRCVPSKNSKPERIVRSYLHLNGFRFRLHCHKLPGKPDVVLPKRRSVVFVHGCFWHRHDGCKYATMPSTRVDFWKEKFFRTQKRDKEQTSELMKLGWKVYVLWECEIKNSLKRRARLERLLHQLSSENSR